MKDSDSLNDNLTDKRERGRPRGVITGSRRELFLLCEKNGVNVFEDIVKLCKHEDINIQITALGMAAKHLYPTLRAVEVTGEIDVNQREKEVKEVVDHLQTLAANNQLVTNTTTNT